MTFCYGGLKGSVVIVIDLSMMDCIKVNEGLSFMKKDCGYRRNIGLGSVL